MKRPDCCNWSLTVYLMYGLATWLNSFATLSIPYNPAPYNYIVEIDFNGAVNGTLTTGNSVLMRTSVLNLGKLRVSLAALC